MKFKIIVFNILLILITVILVETISFSFIKYLSDNRQFFKGRELFNIRDFTELVDKKKRVSLKKNFEIYYSEGRENWSVITSADRIRISSKEKNLNKFDIKNKIKILFLGDSVPFGYGVHAEDSLPNILEQSNKNFISINGAIPSFEISEAIERLKIEFNNIKNLNYIYFHTMDPSTQYSYLGTKWVPGDSWTNKSKPILRQFNLIEIKIPFYGEPYTYTLIKRILVGKIFNLKFYKPDNNSDEKYKKYLETQLLELLITTKSIKAKLILSPVTIPGHVINDKDYYYLRAVDIFNNILREFAEKYNIIYLDKISILSKDSKNFIDNCCHLSKKGSEILSAELEKILLSDL